MTPEVNEKETLEKSSSNQVRKLQKYKCKVNSQIKSKHMLKKLSTFGGFRNNFE
jgi:hypothetical protein